MTDNEQAELAAVKAQEALFREMAGRDSYFLLEEILNSLDEQCLRQLRNADNKKDRLYCQAYSRVIEDLRRNFKRFRPKVSQDKPFEVSTARPIKNLPTGD